ncbi:transferase [Myroides sp. 1354]|uniref:PglD-related sugar-binding protein n=1 Tax=unclassified Myroides TaxID=2642485 RepID=UPI00257739AE|nr:MULTISPECIES: transferase [unclassified Myroides]MDM1044443.1 transferase [Myroides sp. R163-1]MDM1056317.1 transferase [Myroides sp. 1354]MDM1069327.1 transferase [Myroides sp. 1372]
MKKIMIYGKGGHGKVVEDTINQINDTIQVAYFDDASNPYRTDYESEAKVIIGIGNNEVRQRISTEVEHAFDVIIHPTAYVSPSAEIGEGTVVLANAVIQANAKVGKHCIINANVTIDHDAVIEDFVCTYPSSYVAGFARVTALQTLKPGQVVWKSEVF